MAPQMLCMRSNTEYAMDNLPVSYTPPDERRFWRKVRRVVARVPFAEDLLAAYFCAVASQQNIRESVLVPDGLGVGAPLHVCEQYVIEVDTPEPLDRAGTRTHHVVR